MYGVTNTLVFSLSANYVVTTDHVPAGIAAVIGYALVAIAAVTAGIGQIHPMTSVCPTYATVFDTFRSRRPLLRIGTISVAVFFNIVSSVSIENMVAFVKLSSCQKALISINNCSVFPVLGCV